MECVDNHFECEWCVFDNVCHSKTEECASSQLGRVTGPETCPHILNNTAVLIPVGVEQSFKVQAANLPGDENLPGGRPISYKCVLDYEGREVSVPATRLSNSLLECHSESYTFQTEVDQLSVVLSVQWNDIIRIDNPSQFSVILYKCDVERPNCGVCISADAKYQCGWCESTQQCSIDNQCSNWYSGGDLCPTPRVTSFSPRAGPVEGQTNLTIRGINLGQTVSNIHNITVAGHPCDPYPETYITATEIVCMTQGVSNPLSGPIIVRLASENKTEEGHSEQDFRFVVPKIISHRPILGPASGGTRVTITGHDLDAASSIKAVVADHDCTVVSIFQDSIVCVTSPALPGDHGYVGMRFDGRYVEGTLQFTYNPDPTILSIKRFRSIKSGGVPVRVEGTNLNVIQNPQMMFRLPDKNFTANCTVSSPETMFCPTPNMSASSVPLPYETRQGQYGLILDGVKNFTSLEGLPGVQPFEFVSDPYYQKFHEADHIKKLSYGQPKLLTILGENLTLAYEEKDVEVLIGDFRCQKILLAASKLSCDLPDEQPQSTNGDLYPTVLVRHGNLEFYVGKLHYEPKEIPWILIIGVAAGSLLAIIIFMMTLVVYCRKANANERLVKQLEQQRDTLEMKVAKECKEAFAELQTSVNTVTSDLGCGIPFHSYHIYAMKTMFPDQPNHPVLRELPLPRDRKTNSERGLQMFGQLIDNKTFLLCLIQTLEEQRTFNLRDVSAVASLLMVVLQSKMDYATDIMKVLLERLIEKHLEKDRARLLMRRNESVAEKMVSNWLSFLLYNFLVDSAGEPLFTLFYGIKQQVEMGPIDSITGEARYGLSEVKIIRQTIENKTLTIYAMGLDKDADPQQVKVHTCDSISQVKEKILDSIYRTTPYSHRPPKEELDLALVKGLDWDTVSHTKHRNIYAIGKTPPYSHRPCKNLHNLEWRCGLSGRKILPEDNGIIDGDWKRLTMLSDEQVRDGDTIALVPKQGFTMSAFTSPTTGRYTASPCRSTTPMLGSSDVENGVKLWHLVKQSDHDNMKGNEKDHKMMAEIYLPRLLTTKVTLQKFVDDLFETIFSVNYRSNTLPRAIKYLFDFFDDQAKQHGITNPEVVHSWKSNSLPLRFWVNLIKNPHHIFDIYKSDTVDACLSIVGQCLMDACSVSEHQLTKDSPSSKLLYAKDIPKYKEWVARYYDDIKNMPPISDQDMNAVLAEHSNSHQYDFHKLSALNELYHTYAKKYGEQISESLQRDEFGQKYKLAEKFEHVEQLMIDSESNHTI
ncbi:plexin-A4-like isoform X1 [Lytechinus pictus]|uniref:plexin-A4-like isoform X1 n=1 Tax=Lytechinus pictus TaxID=7653 RepID=UPI0030B9CFA8